MSMKGLEAGYKLDRISTFVRVSERCLVENGTFVEVTLDDGSIFKIPIGNFDYMTPSDLMDLLKFKGDLIFHHCRNKNGSNRVEGYDLHYPALYLANKKNQHAVAMLKHLGFK